MKSQAIKLIIITSVGFILLLAGGSLAADDRLNVIIDSCVECHGTDGSSPVLVGMSSDNFITAMKAFKTDQKKSAVMNSIAKMHADETIVLLAKHFEGTR